VGDPLECAAIGATFGQRRPSEQPNIVVGSIKPNIGHLEAAAGIAGAIKALLCVERGLIPPNLLLKNVNPRIDLDGWNLKVSFFGLPCSSKTWAAGTTGIDTAMLTPNGPDPHRTSPLADQRPPPRQRQQLRIRRHQCPSDSGLGLPLSKGPWLTRRSQHRYQPGNSFGITHPIHPFHPSPWFLK
jgi:hypothetical protein